MYKVPMSANMLVLSCDLIILSCSNGCLLSTRIIERIVESFHVHRLAIQLDHKHKPLRYLDFSVVIVNTQ